MRSSLFLIAGLGVGLASTSQAAMFNADSAVAGSQHSSSYDILNAIDGSGLPAIFDASTPHAVYAVNNHWTAASGSILNNTAWAEFSFNSDVTMGTFYMWNHQSNGVASNPDYDVTLFNLRLYDATDTEVFALLNQSAQEDIEIAQIFSFGPVTGVRKARFEILANARPNNDSWTGVAEVRFDTEAVPEPATMAILGLGAAALLRRRRKA